MELAALPDLLDLAASLSHTISLEGGPWANAKVVEITEEGGDEDPAAHEDSATPVDRVRSVVRGILLAVAVACASSPRTAV